MTDRTFVREQLEAWDLPGAWADDAPEILHREQVDTRRWVSVNELIFRAPDDGKTYRVYYDQGLTESQDDTDPWNYDREIKGTEVEQRAKTTMVWEDARVTPSSPADQLATSTYLVTPAVLDLFVRALVNEVDYDIHKGYECGEEDGLDHYPELVAEASKMLAAIVASQAATETPAETDTAPVDLSEWATEIGADGLEPEEHSMTVKSAERPIVRVHFAFAPEVSERMREAFVTGIGEVAAHQLRLVQLHG